MMDGPVQVSVVRNATFYTIIKLSILYIHVRSAVNLYEFLTTQTTSMSYHVRRI